ncbi:MAG: ATP-binding protein [Cyanobacteria bacterium P01_E01_bin.42]
MTITAQKFYRATNPAKTLNISQFPDKQYYIDFSDVRGGEVITELKDRITWTEENEFTCHLFTGHIGCGKSTELLRLRSELEDENYYAIYFEADEDLDMGNVEVSDILLSIARRTAKELENLSQQKESGWQGLIQNAKKLLLTEIKINTSGNIPGVGKFDLGVDFDNNVEIGLSTVIGSIKAQTQKNSDLRDRLRNYLEPKTEGLISVLNQGLFEPIHQALQQQGKAGLVVIIDNLDKLINVEKSNGKTQSTYLFCDRGNDLSRLACHLIYTMPLALRYSDDYPIIEQKFKTTPIVLPMIPVRDRHGNPHTKGIELLYQMVLARAFPELDATARLAKIPELFKTDEVLNKLCQISGGHTRNLLLLLNSWIIKEKKFPLSGEGLQTAIVNQSIEKKQQITPDEWELLRRVHKDKELAGDRDYSKLIRTLSVYEYRDNIGEWYEVNPVLVRSDKLKTD